MDKFQYFKKLYLEDENLNKTKIAEELNLSRQMIYKYIKKIKDGENCVSKQDDMIEKIYKQNVLILKKIDKL